MVSRRIYCDYAASTPIASEVSSAISQMYATFGPGNASSLHYDGRVIRELLDGSRDRVASLIGCDYKDMLFTSGGTESDNLAIIGSLLSRRESGRNGIVVGASEHHAVLDAAYFAQRFLGADVHVVQVDNSAQVDLEHLQSLVDEHTAVVSIQHANNEIGTLQPVHEVAKITKAQGAWFHCDAVQTPITVPFSVSDLGADLVTISSHKIYGPAGIGALYSSVPIEPTHIGGTQERGLRAGSENIGGIVGFRAAADLELRRRATGRMEIQAVAAHVEELRRQLTQNPRITVNTPQSDVIPTILHVSILGRATEDLLLLLDRKGISASGGAACASGAVEPSHVVQACDWTAERQKGALRLSFGIGTTRDDIDYVAETVGLLASSG